MKQDKISVVIPSYNEEENIIPVYEALSSILQKENLLYELIFVNNGSFDRSDEIFEELAKKDDKVKVIFLSRNFGSQNAYSAGLSVASGDAVVCIDGDLQDPPELIHSFIEKWREGYQIVYGIRTKRKGSIIKRIGYKIFYRILKKWAYVDIPLDAGDFCIMDKCVVKLLNMMPEKDRFLRGLRAYVGFKQIGIEYVREERKKGKPKYGFLDNVRMAFKWFFSYSYSPLELISIFAFVVGMIAIIGIIYYMYRYFVVKDTPQGWMTTVTLILLIGAIQLVSLSIIGAYISRLFEEIKGRPNFIISKILNEDKGLSKKDNP